MLSKKFTRPLLAALLMVGSAITLDAASRLSKEHGNTLEQKIDAVAQNGSLEPPTPKKTTLTEVEVNSYLSFNLSERIPRGLTHPQISLLGDGNVGGRVFVDIDEFKRQRGSGGIADPFSYISGRVPVTARGVLRSSDGTGQFQLTSAEMYGVPLPKPIVQELVSFFSRTPENPRGVSIDKPFRLPARIRQVIVNQGAAIVVQ
jgi:hypothetical protein